MSIATLRRQIVKDIGGLEKWAHKCHECSLAIVHTGLLPKEARVARGRHPHLTSQHSWVVIGDPYNPENTILDATLWSYTGEKPKLFIGKNFVHKPHGAGSIWDFGKPPAPVQKTIALKAKLSSEAKHFLQLAAPKGLDARGWMVLANSPVGGWPASEIIGAMYDDERLSALVPVDIVGMVTDKNPGKLYF